MCHHHPASLVGLGLSFLSSVMLLTAKAALGELSATVANMAVPGRMHHLKCEGQELSEAAVWGCILCCTMLCLLCWGWNPGPRPC